MAALVGAWVLHYDEDGKLVRIPYKEEMRRYGFLPNLVIPICIEPSLEVLMKINTSEYESLFDGPKSTCTKEESEKFLERIKTLSTSELVGITLEKNEVLNELPKLIPCIGCRKIAEESYKDCADKGWSGHYPYIVDADNSMYIAAKERDPKKISEYLLPKNFMRNLMKSFEKFSNSTKLKRCNIHCLEFQRGTSLNAFVDVWESMNQHCQEGVLIIQKGAIERSMECYFKKHSFCKDCRAKVLKAYGVLLGEIDKSEECVEGYVEALFEGIKYDSAKRVIRIKPEASIVASLIGRALPEIAGGVGERHAKSMTAAQEEILTAMGICLYGRFGLIQHRFREEKRSWEIIMCVATSLFRRKLDFAIDDKAGMKSLAWCDNMKKEEEAKARRKQLKRQRKKENRKLKELENVNVTEIPVEDGVDEIPGCSEIPKGSDADSSTMAESQNKRLINAMATVNLPAKSETEPSSKLHKDYGYDSGSSRTTSPASSEGTNVSVDYVNGAERANDENFQKWNQYGSLTKIDWNCLKGFGEEDNPTEAMKQVMFGFYNPELALRSLHFSRPVVFVSSSEKENIEVQAIGGAQSDPVTTEKSKPKNASRKPQQQKSLRNYKGRNRHSS